MLMNDNTLLSIFQIVILVFSAVVHEVSHGYAALAQGDQTAKFYGRLTLNPIKHLDPIGSIFLPLFLFLARTSFLFAYAKPVPVNPDNFRDTKYGVAKVSFAGPGSNLAIAIAIGIVIRIGSVFVVGFDGSRIQSLLIMAVFINVLLAVFNLLPIPPLDGSKILFTLLPYRTRMQFGEAEIFLEKWGMVILFGFLFIGGFSILSPLLFFLTSLFAGI